MSLTAGLISLMYFWETLSLDREFEGFFAGNFGVSKGKNYVIFMI